MEEQSTQTHILPDSGGDESVWAERTGVREFIGGNRRGVRIPIGKGEGQISPGELLKLALIGCAGMSMDLAVGRRVGEDFDARLWANGSDEVENRYRHIQEEIQISADGLTADQLRAMRKVIDKAIEVGCTVQRTVTGDTTVAHTLTMADGTVIASEDQTA